MIFPTAEQLAADLAGSKVDPNEAQKALAYLRSKRDPKALFSYLDAIIKDGSIVIRSNQTLDYYRELRTACLRHLQGMDYDKMVQTLGWALRLLRYYRAVPEAVKQAVAAQLPPDQPTTTSATNSASSPQLTSGNIAKPKRPKAPKQVGDTFVGNVLKRDEEVFLIEEQKNPHVRAILKRESGVPNYQPGNAVRVEVVHIEELKDSSILHVRLAKKKTEA